LAATFLPSLLRFAFAAALCLRCCALPSLLRFAFAAARAGFAAARGDLLPGVAAPG
jgi:hypothetical protein